MNPAIGGELYVMGFLVVVAVVFLYCGAWAVNITVGLFRHK